MSRRIDPDDPDFNPLDDPDPRWGMIEHIQRTEGLVPLMGSEELNMRLLALEGLATSPMFDRFALPQGEEAREAVARGFDYPDDDEEYDPSDDSYSGEWESEFFEEGGDEY